MELLIGAREHRRGVVGEMEVEEPLIGDAYPKGTLSEEKLVIGS